MQLLKIQERDPAEDVIQTQHATELYLIEQIQKQKYREEMQEIHRIGQIELQKLNITKAQLKLKE